MNFKLNSSLNGEYFIYDENKNLLASTSNLVTDWGMRRFLGDQSTGNPSVSGLDLPIQAFCYNFSNLYIGTDGTAVTPNDWKLGNRVLPLSAEVMTLETGTESKLAQDGDLVMIYTVTEKLTFPENLSSSIVIREVGSNWTDIEQQNNRYGIFSRAVLPTSSYVTLDAGRTNKQIIFLKYIFYFKTDCNKILGSMPHTKSSGTPDFPPNKTNVRRLPLYTMDSLGRPIQTLNYGLWSDPVDGNPRTNDEYVQPLFENMSLTDDLFVGSGFTGVAGHGGNTTQGDTGIWQSNLLETNTIPGGYNARKVWWLQYYTIDQQPPTDIERLMNGGTDPSNRYNDFYSTTTTNLNNSSRNLAITRCGFLGSVASTNIVNKQVMLDTNANFPLSPFMGRIPHDYTALSRNGNNWTRKIQFFATPGQIRPNVTVLKMYPATLGAWNNTISNYGDCYYHNSLVYVDYNAYHDYGIVTTLSAGYTPNPTYYNGFEYTFNFTRPTQTFSQAGNTISTQGFRTPEIYFDANSLSCVNPANFAPYVQSGFVSPLSSTIQNLGTLSADRGTNGIYLGVHKSHIIEDGQYIFNFYPNYVAAALGTTNPGAAYVVMRFPEFNFGNEPITINFWVKFTGIWPSPQPFVSNTSGQDNLPQGNGFSFHVYNNDIHFYQPNENTYQTNYLGAAPYASIYGALADTTRWRMITMTYHPKNKMLEYFIDGQKRALSFDQRNDFYMYTTTPAPSGWWRIGADPISLDQEHGYRSAQKLGEIKIFKNYVPDSITILNEFNNGKVRYKRI